MKGNKDITKVMDKTWSNRAHRNAKKYIALSSWKTDEAFDKSGLLDAQRRLKELPKDRIYNWTALEVGGGIGRITKHMSKHFKEIIMVDVSSEMVNRAKNRLANYKNVHVQKTDGTKIPFSKNKFDIVYSIFVFQHMPRKIFIKYLNEIHRVSKPNSLLRFQIFEKTKIFSLIPWYWLRNLRNLNLTFWVDPPDTDTWVARSYSRKELISCLDKSRYDVLNMENLSGKEGDLWVTVKVRR